MRKFLISTAALIALAHLVFAADIDRHADYVDTTVAAAPATQCKGFYGTEDNRTACQDWCTQWTGAHDGAACTCNDGKCAADDH